MDQERPDAYEGEVDLIVDGGEPLTARAAVAARFDPLAGHVVRTGRVTAELPLRTSVVLSTPHGSARAATTERDPWGNTRVSGTDRPPFPVKLLDPGG